MSNKPKPLFPPLLVDSATNLFLARHLFVKCWDMFYGNLAELSGDEFWPVASHFTRLVLERVTNKNIDPVDNAADELFRLEATGQSPFSFETLLRFVVTWEELDGALAEDLYQVVEDYGEDSYHDLCDALGLAGQDFCDRCNGDGPTRFKTDAEFKKAFKQLPKPIQKLVKDELHIGSTLEEHARQRTLDKIAGSSATKKFKEDVRDEAYNNDEE